MNQHTQSVSESEQGFTALGGGLSEESKLELLEYWRSITKRKWAILALGLVVAVLAGAIAFSITPEYRATTTVLIEQGKRKVLSIEDVYGGASQEKEHYQTQVEILKSREVATRVVRGLRLWEYPEFDVRKPDDSVIGKIKSALGIQKTEATWTEDKLVDAVVDSFSKQLSVEPVRLSQLVKVSFTAEDKKLAALVANTVADSYISADREAKFKMTQQANNWLQERTQSLRDKLVSSEQALQAYREKAGIVSLSGSAQTMIGQQIGEVTQRLVEAKARRAEAESAYEQMRLVKDGDYSSVPAVVRNQAVGEARKAEAAASQKVAELQQRYGAEHPKMVQATSEQKAAKDNLMRQMQSVAASLTREYESAKATERALEGALNSARGSVQNVNRQEFQLGVLEREVQTNKQLYEMFMNRAKETHESGDLQSAVARVVDAAVAPMLPVKPKKGQVIAIALVLGLFAGVLVSLLLDKLDNTVKGIEDAERRFQLPVLSALPELGAQAGKNAMTMFIDKPESHLAEAVRTARTGVLLSNLDAACRVLVVTSSVPGEGKTTVASNLALAHAQTKRTLLIDADMRRPQVARRLALPPAARGLSALVAGTARLEECIHSIKGSSLAVMPVGEVPPNPAELLLSQRFRETLEVLAKHYEVIIIDSPPVELVSDALVIAPLATSVVYVVRAMETPYPLVRKGLVRLQRSGGNLLGVVLNHLDFKKAQTYYGEYSGYGKDGYEGYGYSQKTKSAA
ncbi:polysaccharide biosynthesis tyrosine autokinase [Uliginosibacterium sp. 31-12]|uniref:GumC family protein n=1 Tax=Uliginosibacterium sp. 31-12 TaxID=3062781 RepID=UPI0026E38BF7|nr:polysaccharide biosynthesis tyrosine autokinase [Uliginosibacterium sp. 31-12]MDO6386043.1 polysaccharide biosynthesis tyrosine autokinase [Uliginosibacterium sp. 31-12]